MPTALGQADRLQYIEISRAAILHNIRQFRRLIGGRRRLLAVVKANAYGHGIAETAGIFAGSGADWLGVNSLEEGVLLRKIGLKLPILVLGYTPIDSIEKLVIHDLRTVIYNTRTVTALAKAARKHGKRIPVHIKLETGTHRQGVLEKDVLSFIAGVKNHSGLILEGLSSHFANIEDTTKHDYPRYQLETFQRICRRVDSRGVRIPIKHMSCTAATMLFPETYFNMARVGIGLYGLWPSKETYLSCLMRKRRPLSLKPVLSWKARIAQIKNIPADSCISYGCTFKTTRKTKLAVIPAGYFDGYSRALSNVSHVLVRGRRAPLRGRVAMDFIMADITDIPGVRLEDEATLIGRDGGECVSVDDLATYMGTINYEVVARLNPQIPRIVI